MNKHLLALALLAGLSGTAFAERPWLLPSSTVVDGKDVWVTIDGAISENLFDYDYASLKLDTLIVTGPDGLPVTPENRFQGHLRSSVDVKLDKPGTYRASVVNESAFASYKLGGETKRWRGAVDAVAKEIPANAEELTVTRAHSRLETFVTLGKPGGVALKPVGVGIELEALTHPNDLRAGEPVRLRFLIDGKPAPQLAFSLVPGAVRYRGVLNEVRMSTDAKGEFTFTLPDAGRYWLNASFPARVEGGPPPTRRLSYAATIEVLPQ